MTLTPEELKEARNARDRARRARIKADKIAERTYDKATDLEPHVIATLDKRSLYLAFLEKGLRRTQAAAKTGVSYSTVRYWRKTDDKFREAEVEREEQHLDEIEDRLRNVIASDALPKDMMAYLARRRPDMWSEKTKVEHEVTMRYDGSDDERRDRIAQLIKAHKLDIPVLDAVVVDDPAVPENAA